MKHKMVRILSPLSVLTVLMFDDAALVLGVFSVKKILVAANFYTVSFLIIELIVIAVAVLTTRELLTNGVQFDDMGLTFTGLDSNNRFAYADIAKIETHKDTKASLKKNFVDRYSSIIFYMKDGSVTTVELGLTTKRKLKQIEEEIKKRTEI